MNYARACAVLGLSTANSTAQNARLAETILSNCSPKTQLRIKVACRTLIAQEGK